MGEFRSMSLQMNNVINELITYSNSNAVSNNAKQLLKTIIDMNINFSRIPQLIAGIIITLRNQWERIQKNNSRASELLNMLQSRGFKGSRKEQLHFLINGKHGLFNIGGEKGLKDLWETRELKELETSLEGVKPIKSNNNLIIKDLKKVINFYKEELFNKLLTNIKSIPEKKIEKISQLKELTSNYLNKVFKIRLVWVLQQISKDLMPIEREKMIKALKTINEISIKQQKALFIIRNT